MVAPDGGTTVRTFQPDGRLASVTGSAVVAQYYSCGVESDGRQWSQVNSGSSSENEQLVLTHLRAHQIDPPAALPLIPWLLSQRQGALPGR